MKFKVLKGTKLFDQLTKVGEDIREADNTAYKLGKELGYKSIRGGRHVLGGGISAFQSSELPKGWKYAYPKSDREAVFPMNKKVNKELLDRIAALPKVEHEALNKILKFDPWKHNDKAYNGDGSFKIQWYPGIQWKDEYVLLDVSEYMVYKPVKDMIEILESEYEKLSKAKNKKIKKLASDKV